jgi:hypothetical protein
MFASSSDRAAWSLLVSNLLALAVFWATGGDFLMLLWPYWIQSMVIGCFAWKRILKLKRFTAVNVRMNDEPVPTTPEGARRTGAFFAVFYFTFHLIYLLFLAVFTLKAQSNGGYINFGPRRFFMGDLSLLDFAWALFVGAAFFATHRASHREHVAADLRGSPDIGTLFFYPVARIVPMHLTLLFGWFLSGGAWLPLFGALKTGVDILMHKVVHRQLQRGNNLKASAL